MNYQQLQQKFKNHDINKIEQERKVPKSDVSAENVWKHNLSFNLNAAHKSNP
jgi:hypothetical protein